MPKNQNFLGFKPIIKILEKQIQKGNLGHAYLFLGPRGAGKRILVEILLKKLNKKERHKSEGLDPDRKIVEAKEREVIKIDQIREVSHFLALSPYSSFYKVGVILDAENLTLEAANALLKSLEEPPAHSVLILTAANRASVLPTIYSRCQVFYLRPLSTDVVYKYLIFKKTKEKIAKQAAALSGGLLGRAEEIVNNPKIFKERKGAIQKIKEINETDLTTRFQAIASIMKDQKKASDFLLVWISVFRDLLYVKYNLSGNITNLFCRNDIIALAREFSVRKIKKILSRAEEIKKLLKDNLNPRLALEALLLEL